MQAFFDAKGKFFSLTFRNAALTITSIEQLLVRVSAAGWLIIIYHLFRSSPKRMAIENAQSSPGCSSRPGPRSCCHPASIGRFVMHLLTMHMHASSCNDQEPREAGQEAANGQEWSYSSVTAALRSRDVGHSGQSCFPRLTRNLCMLFQGGAWLRWEAAP